LSWRWVLLKTVLAVHDRQIDDHGGMPGIRDKGLLESALQRPRSVAAYREDVDVFDLAAACFPGTAERQLGLPQEQPVG
jgi:death-on-curing protein